MTGASFVWRLRSGPSLRFRGCRRVLLPRGIRTIAVSVESVRRRPARPQCARSVVAAAAVAVADRCLLTPADSDASERTCWVWDWRVPVDVT